MAGRPRVPGGEDRVRGDVIANEGMIYIRGRESIRIFDLVVPFRQGAVAATEMEGGGFDAVCAVSDGHVRPESGEHGWRWGGNLLEEWREVATD